MHIGQLTTVPSLSTKWESKKYKSIVVFIWQLTADPPFFALGNLAAAFWRLALVLPFNSTSMLALLVLLFKVLPFCSVTAASASLPHLFLIRIGSSKGRSFDVDGCGSSANFWSTLRRRRLRLVGNDKSWERDRRVRRATKTSLVLTTV